jgi:hypothetical protein
MSKQPYALWLADRFDDVGDWYEFDAKTWVPGAAAELRRLHSVNAELLVALQKLLRRDELNTCQHHETHRGGVLWTICSDCGRKWADDEGGMPKWRDPPEWKAARAAIALATPAPSTQEGQS